MRCSCLVVAGGITILFQVILNLQINFEAHSQEEDETYYLNLA